MLTTQPMKRTVLFLCTGNYYRSRFAEELFNHKAAAIRIGWQAQSRALAIERGVGNIGPLSPFALHALQARGCSPTGAARMPCQCVTIDLESAQRIIALNEPEHRPLIRARFPEWEQRVHFWQVEDVEFVRPDVALGVIEKQIDALLGLTSRRGSGMRRLPRPRFASIERLPF
jgi:protein-tyrosine phosphatase